MPNDHWKIFPAGLKADFITRDIKTLPSCLRRGGAIRFESGVRLIRGANGTYLAYLSDGPPPVVRGFESEDDLIVFINDQKPWTPIYPKWMNR